MPCAVTILKTNKQSCFSIGSINNRMYIALNSTRTANFDSRPAVTTFLNEKEWRKNLSDQNTGKKIVYSLKKYF